MKAYFIRAVVSFLLLLPVLFLACNQAIDPSEFGSREKPAPLNVKVKNHFNFSIPDELPLKDQPAHYLEMWTSDLTRGKKALDLMKKFYPDTPAPPAGQEYITVKVHALLIAVSEPPKWALSLEVILDRYKFQAYPTQGDPYPETTCEPPAPRLFFALNYGESCEGYLVFTVPKTDTRPVMRSIIQNNPIWFALYH